MRPKPLADLMNLSGKTAIVTGGAMGIGEAIARRLAEAGSAVLIADRDAPAAAATAAVLSAKGARAVAAGVDVTDEAHVEAMVAQAVREFGGVDILVSNAGVYPHTPVLEATQEDFERTMRVNLLGAFFAARASAKQMIAQGRGGSIIMITSIDALHPSSVGLAFYDASKHGLWGFTKNLALELAPHAIRVNAIAPGSVATPGTNFLKGETPEAQRFIDAYVATIPLRRPADADEIGTAALFLASDLSSYMTGAQIVVDGGILLT
ncbi:SDR family oxidoreductase [Patescibacteria group bacterium]|nr:SDR family oxidoreductase [Patescibacteria group bacterium]